MLRAIEQAQCGLRSAVRAVDLATGGDRFITSGASSAPALAAAGSLHANQSRSVEIDGRSWFLMVANPPDDLAIIGAVQITQPLVKIAALVGFRARDRSVEKTRAGRSLAD